MTLADIRRTEERLGVGFHHDFVALLLNYNGGTPQAKFVTIPYFPSGKRIASTEWAPVGIPVGIIEEFTTLTGSATCSLDSVFQQLRKAEDRQTGSQDRVAAGRYVPIAASITQTAEPNTHVYFVMEHLPQPLPTVWCIWTGHVPMTPAFAAPSLPQLLANTFGE